VPASRLRGVVPPVITPFRPDGTIDTDSLVRATERLLSAGCHGVFVLGSTGEVAYLDAEQRATAVRIAVEVTDGRVPVLVGAIDTTARRVLEQARQAERLGADGIVATGPLYARNDTAETAAHFRLIAAGVDLPVYAYDIPARVHTKLDLQMLVELGTEGVIAGVKDSSGDDVGFRRLVAANATAGSPLSLLTGHEIVVDGMLLLGADGVVPGLGNVDPVGYVRLWELAEAQDWSAARDQQERLAALFEIVFQAQGRSGDAAGVGAFKIAMHELGVISSPAMATPVQALEGPTAEQIREIVRAARPEEPEVV